MAEYDGSIRIVTKITTKDAEESLASLEWQIKKSAKYMDELRSKMDALKNQKIPTKDYKDLQEKLSVAEKELKELVAKQERYNEIGITSDDAWGKLNEKVATASDKVDLIKEKMQALTDSGKDFILGKDTAQYKAYEQQLLYEEEAIKKAGEHYNRLLGKTKESYKKLGDIAKKSFNSIGNVLKKANSLINSFGKRTKSVFANFRKSADSTNRSVHSLATSFKNMIKYAFGISGIYALFGKLRSAITDGFENLLNYSGTSKSSINNLKASALTLKNAFAAAFSPFVEIAIPYIQKLLDYMTQLVNIAGQFFAAITGKKTYIKAIKQTTDALEEETKAMDKQLSPLDKLNNLSSEKSSNASAGTGETMFEEVPIEGDILNIAEKIRDILSKLFEPLKEAWNREGKFVMESWKYALDEVWKLIKDVGRDFLTVWQQEATIKIFEDLLHIIGDIGLIVGNLARNFREAWNENDVGLHILENIRDIIGIIVSHIRNAADATVKWSDKLDFYPLLDAFNRFLESLEPVVDALSGILEDFYTMVLLPLGKWVLEEGLPKLLQVFIDFNNKVDWKTLRSNLAEFWKHLEPFAETVGEGLILFIEDVSDALANFLNSQEFKDFLTTVENWMDSVTPEDVADALEKIAKGIIVLKLALLGFSAIKGLASMVTVFKNLLPLFGILKSGIMKLVGLFSTEGIVGSAISSFIGLMKSFASELLNVTKIALSTTKTALVDVGSLLINGIASGIAGAGGISGLLTADLGTLITGGSLATAGVTIGAAILGGIASALGGGVIGKLLDNYILAPIAEALGDKELAAQYKNFKWFGKGGFFDQLIPDFSSFENFKQDMKLFFDSFVQMATDFENHPVIAGLTNIIGGPIVWLITVITEAKAALDNFDVAGWFQTSVAPWFTKEKWEELGQKVLDGLQIKWGEIKEKWSDTWDSVSEKVNTILSNIKIAIGNAFDWIANKINSIKAALGGISISVKSAISGKLGGLASGVFSKSKSAYSAYPAFATLNDKDFPGYATGQVIPRSMKQHLAWLGDNNRETEVVSPLSTIEQAVINAMAKVNGNNGNSGGNVQEINLNLTVECEGYKLLQLFKKLDGEYFKQTGKHVMA